MRIGYALGQEPTLAAIRNAWGMGDVSMLAAVAALTALEDKEHIEWERQENARVKAFTLTAFREIGYRVPYSHTNHIFVDIRGPAAAWRKWKSQCRFSAKCSYLEGKPHGCAPCAMNTAMETRTVASKVSEFGVQPDPTYLPGKRVDRL